ncbi:MAG TPA: hypothetical protein VGU61_01670 [Noviherbaspirillum sp.]|uniref:hypothetical protein n=1 Tax=Noviherbaspirillum sp. TaxID=1926288 RepID=UPI002DDD647F|nr:hypothetical protein [Noviherbaspirillum sp.]HEV2608947.1 hypothetical protein [Noviherbaspirillum sp.]
MNDKLTLDEFDALAEIGAGQKKGKPSARVSRNAKRLSGLKYAEYRKDGTLELTEKGKQTLFIKRCIDGLRALSIDPHAQIDAGVVTFLSKKGHIKSRPADDGYDVTQRGLETLADIDANPAST